MKKNIITLAVLAFFASQHGVAQDANEAPSNDSLNKSIQLLKKDIDVAKNLKISGWVQVQYQLADTLGVKNFDGGDFPVNSDQRFMIRRGRIKFTYNQKNTQYVMQINGTERGLSLVEVYTKYTDPFKNVLSLTAGIMNRPFGFEVPQSSSERETPERSRFIQNLLPNERDCGAMLTFQPVKGKKLYGLRVDAGEFNGVGIAVPGTGIPAGSTAAIGTTGVNGFTDFDKYKDFIGRAYFTRTNKSEKFKFGIGASYLDGGFAYQNNIVYDKINLDAAGNKVWVIADTITSSFKGKKAPKIYKGVDAQVTVKSFLGTTTLRGEYVIGTQTGRSTEYKSVQATPSSSSANYVRNFEGCVVYFIQRIGKSKHEIALRYDWIDPNTDLSSGDFNGKNGMKEGELKYTSMGAGYNFYFDPNMKLMVYYNMVTNETGNFKGYTRDLKDNILTVRVQYKF
jgi:hypothetical protein